VPTTGLEPALEKFELPPQGSVYTNFTT